MIKKTAKSLIVSVLGWQVRRLCKKTNVTVVAVAGSVGKTSTKFAIADVLGSHMRVRTQAGNYNDLLTVPLVFFGHTNPSTLVNPLTWLRLFWANEKQIRTEYPFDVVVIELGTDGPGQLMQFDRYLKVDIAVLTAIAPEHMEFFEDLDAVAKEELSVSSFSERVVLNADLCGAYTKDILATTYGLHVGDFYLSNISLADQKYSFVINEGKKELLKASYDGVAETELYSALAAVVVGSMLGVSAKNMQDAVSHIVPPSGRMRRLKGLHDSLILDDTYNASPDAAKAALDTLYKLDSPNRIALLGNMNELGKHSEKAHRDIGRYCDPEKLSLVVTIGPDANEFLAPAAKQQGCIVETFTSPYEAAKFLKPKLTSETVLLAKGSQNGVYAEETVKLLLADPKDVDQLVRQSPQWLRVKSKQFGKGSDNG